MWGLIQLSLKRLEKGKHPSYEIKLTEDFSINLYLVSMGNPHGVCWEEFDENLRLNHIFEMINATKAFSNEVNIEFCKKESKKALSMRVFERGVGETEACGSGACAAVVSGILNGFLSANELIEVKMRQGSLFVKWDGDLLSPVSIVGPSNHSFRWRVLCVRHINLTEIEINVKSSIEEQKVREFLLSEKDFFLRNEDLLCLLKLSHPNTRGLCVIT
ncbi:MAG: hypothetical protein CM15mP58_08990 [Burkholderiaceae bacterium]|nr:MAG: hypothetical protein CM15mP58_08990 [Burkholderiaceae bacterium]